MKSLPAWSNANKISLYVHKTWLTFLTSKEKIRWKRKQNLVGKDYLSQSANYIGIKF